jgi:hypothetical protein
MANLTLFVYVIGLERPFSVDIQRSKTVDHLKKAILKEKPNDLKDIDADHLDLFKVDILYDSNFEGSVCQAFREELDNPFTTLSEIFTKKPRAKAVSILVEIPVIGE